MKKQTNKQTKNSEQNAVNVFLTLKFKVNSNVKSCLRDIRVLNRTLPQESQHLHLLNAHSHHVNCK